MTKCTVISNLTMLYVQEYRFYFVFLFFFLSI